MLVLTIIGAVIALLLTYVAIEKIDAYANDRYGYDFFNTQNFIIAFVGNVLLFFGYKWYQNALLHSGDTLNGILLMLFGVVVLVVLVYKNLAATSFAFGLAVTLLQLVLFAVASIFVVYGLLLAMAWFAQTKPVYTINDD